MDSKNIFCLIKKYRYTFILIVLFSGICATIFSSKHFITPLYKSTVVLYPTSTYSVSKSLFNTNKLVYVDPLEIGDENQTDQMLQILKSNLIKNQIIDKYNLTAHYGIKDSDKYKIANLYKEYDSKIRCRRTEHNAVMITVMDTDALYAANIANDIAALFDSTMNNLQKDFANRALEIIEDEYNRVISEKDILEDSLTNLTTLETYNYDIHINSLYEQLSVEISKNNTKAVNNLENKIKDITNNHLIVKDLLSEIEQRREYLTIVKTKLDEARLDATQVIPHKFVVTTAFPTEKPIFPIRWVIILVTMVSTLMLTLLVICILDNNSEQIFSKNG